MAAGLFVLEIFFFGLAFWLGAYLISRDPKNGRLWLAGLNLLSYALAEGCFVLSNATPPSALTQNTAMIGRLLLLLPILVWIGSMLYHRPEEIEERARLIRIGHVGLSKGSLIVFIILVVLVSIVSLPFSWVPYTALRLLIGCVLLPAGLLIARADALDQGEALLPHIFRAFDYSCFMVLMFGGQVALVIMLVTGPTFPMLLLLLAVIATAIFIQVFSGLIVACLDQIAFATFPQLLRARAELHTAADTLPRINQELDLEVLDEAEFTRLTRRALSHFGDLARLAANPLTHLPQVQARLQARGAKDDALERATELKTLLTESVGRLKPRDKGDFGTSDEWRYYNALYFPYIVGLKPYSRRSQHVPADPVVREALSWFRSQVPERTLYNWQGAATKLVAQDLRGQDAVMAVSAKKKTRTSSGVL